MMGPKTEAENHVAKFKYLTLASEMYIPKDLRRNQQFANFNSMMCFIVLVTNNFSAFES